MSQERRQHYRVSVATEREVSVRVRIRNGHAQSVGLIDVSAGGVAIAVSADDALDVQSTENVVVEFDSKRLGQALQIQGHMRHIKPSEDGNSIMYGIAFDPWSESRLDLTPKLRALFNEREAVRVEPVEDEHVEVQLIVEGNTPHIAGLLRDISVFGLGVWVSAEDELELREHSRFRLNLLLPTGTETLVVDVNVRHMQAIGPRSRIGLEFCSEDASARRAQQREITQYVMTRQIEIARIDAERRRAMESHYPSR